MHEFNLRLLRYFAAVADEGNVGRAAASLFVSQPALSQQIRRLEAELGLTLFHRSSRGMHLTAAGEQILAPTRNLLAAAQALRNSVLASRGGGLRLGFIGNGLGQLNAEIRAALRERLPETDLMMRQLEQRDHVLAVLSGAVDVALVRLPVREETLTVVPVFAEPRLLCLPTGHPLAGRCHVTIGELATEVFLDVADGVPRHWREFWLVEPRPGGEPVRLGPAFSTAEEALQLVAGGKGVVLVAASFVDGYRRSELAFVPVADIGPSEVGLAWRGATPPSGGRELLESVREVVGAQPGFGSEAFRRLGCSHGPCGAAARTTPSLDRIGGRRR